jgi:hypothetical protein
MRHLFYVPIIHTQADLGSLGPVIQRSAAELQASESWAEKQRTIEALWVDIRAEVLALPISWRKTRIYQDGLPICGNELAIVKDTAGKGSPNHRLLIELVERGATLMGTEDPRLLVREYQRMQRIVKLAQAPLNQAVFKEIKRAGEELLRLRDVFMAERILSTLDSDETGILFIGLLHRADDLLTGRGICLRRLDLHYATGARQPQNSEANEP